MLKRLLIALAFVLCATPVFAQETNMRTYVDACYTDNPGYLQCAGWAFRNGTEPSDVTYTVGTCDGNWCIDNRAAGLMLKESRPDVCNVAHSWPWGCDDDDWSNCPWNAPTACVGYRQWIDLSALTPGRYFARLVAIYGDDIEGSPYIYVFDWDGTSASFVTWLDTPFEG